jgi:hypothetical protein
VVALGLGAGSIGTTNMADNPTDFMAPAKMLHGLANDHHQAVAEHHDLLSRMKKTLDGLTALGPAVTADEVYDKASDLVIDGADPKAIAGLLGSMPQGGEQINQWLLQQDQKLGQQLQVMQAARAQARHATGVRAMQMLAADHFGPNQPPPQVGPLGGSDAGPQQ